MAGAHRNALDPVKEIVSDTEHARLRRGAVRAEFFQTVRLILAARGGAAGASGIGIGGDARPEDEALRFHAVAGLRHPDAEIAALAEGEGGAPVAMDASFMGLTGPSGVLPDHYSDRVVEGRRANDEAFGRFLDLFNHRALSHFYRAWAKYRLPVRLDETGGDLSDPFSRSLAALAGIARHDGDPRPLSVAGPLARRIRSVSAVRRIVTALFDLPISIVELQPRWIQIAPEEQTRIASAGSPRGRYAQLGVSAVAGASTYDLGGRFRLRIGPLDLPRFRAFFDADGVRDRLIETVRFAVGPNVDFDLQLVLRRDAVPRLQMGGGAAPAALGQNGWLLAGPSERDREDAVLSSRRLGRPKTGAA